MAYENNNNNAPKRDNVNTRGFNLSNAEGVIAQSTLVFGFWNDLISIKLHPALPKSEQSEKKRFNYDHALSTALTLEKAMELSSIIAEAKTSDKPRFFKGVQVGMDSLVGVSAITEDDKTTIVFGIYKGLDPETRLPSEKLLYEFRRVRVIEDYNDETGNYKMKESAESSELNLFERGLLSAIDHLTNASVHADRHVNNYKNKMQTTTMNSIANKVGAETGYQNTSYGNRGGYGGGSSKGPFEQKAVNEEVSNVSDINSLLG